MDDEIAYANNIITVCCVLLLFGGLWCFVAWQYAAVIAVLIGMLIEFALSYQTTATTKGE